MDLETGFGTFAAISTLSLQNKEALQTFRGRRETEACGLCLPPLVSRGSSDTKRYIFCPRNRERTYLLLPLGKIQRHTASSLVFTFTRLK